MGDEFFGGLHSGAFDHRDLSSGAGGDPDEAAEGTPGSADSG